MKKRIIAIIPARKGSKGIINKNIRKINGKPLISWTIEAAKKVNSIGDIVVSTDSKDIAKVSIKNGAKIPFMRPKKYSQDHSLSIDLVMNILNKTNYKDSEYVILLQPTSPLRKSNDIKKIIQYAIDNDLDSVVSVCEVKDHPELMYTMTKSNSLRKEFKNLNSKNLRQNYKKLYRISGAMYLCKTNWLIKKKKFVTDDTHGYLMPLERSIDIDDLYDWKIAELILKN